MAFVSYSKTQKKNWYAAYNKLQIRILGTIWKVRNEAVRAQS